MTILQIMRGLTPSFKYFIAFSFSVLLIFFAYYFLKPNKLNFFFDNIISDSIKEKILDKLDLNLVKTNSAFQLLKSIKKYCPAVKNVSIDYRIPLNAKIKINIDKPLLILKFTSGHIPDLTSPDLINRAHALQILTQHGLIDSINSFRPETSENLNTIFIDNTKINDTDLKKFTEFALSLKSEIFEKYIITWCSDLNILLKSIKQNFLIIADVVSIQDTNKLSNAELICKQKSKEKRELKIDIRLKDSIVCRAHPMRHY